MKAALRFALTRATRILVGGTLAAAAYLSFMIAGPLIEAKYFPVVSFSEIIQRRDGNQLTLDAMFTKHRPCEYVGSQWYLRNAENEFVDVPMHYPSRLDVRSRPVGRNYDRDWVIDLPTDGSYESLELVLSYRCGLPWQTLTMVGPVKIPRY